jgi:hypothetical protein
MAKKRYSKLETLVLFEAQKLAKRASPNKKKKTKPKKAKRKKQRYLRDEPTYNAHQDNEFIFFITALPFIVFNALVNSKLPLKTLQFKRYFVSFMCLAIKEYFQMSLRRARGLCKFIFWAMKWKCDIPCFKTLNNYMNKRETKKILNSILEFSVEPLKCIETRFNLDSTNSTTRTASSWYDIRIGRKRKRKDHLKEHVTSTHKYNAAVAVDISPQADPRFTRPHVNKITSQGFKIAHFCGDAAYLTRDGCNAVREAGGKAHFKIKSNTITNAKGSQEWKRTTTAQKNEDPTEIDDYNIRQNAETTNKAKKAKFGSTIKCKQDTTKEAEALMKWCVYNTTTICRAHYDGAIEPNYTNLPTPIQRLLTYT